MNMMSTNDQVLNTNDNDLNTNDHDLIFNYHSLNIYDHVLNNNHHDINTNDHQSEQILFLEQIDRITNLNKQNIEKKEIQQLNIHTPYSHGETKGFYRMIILCYNKKSANICCYNQNCKYKESIVKIDDKFFRMKTSKSSDSHICKPKPLNEIPMSISQKEFILKVSTEYNNEATALDTFISIFKGSLL